MKKSVIILLAVLLLLSASGCGSLFSEEYYHSEPYEGEVSIGDGTEAEPRNYEALKSAIMELVQSGQTGGQFRFGSYDGSLVDDLAAVCHEIRTSSPIGAYAVEDISVDTSRIVSYYIADIHIEYRKSPEEIAGVVNLSGLGELGSHILSLMEEHSPGTVIKIYSSAATEDYIRSFISDSYYADPFLSAELPESEVRGYPNFGPERIFEIELAYSAEAAQLREMKTILRDRAKEMARSLGKDDQLGLAVRCAQSLAIMCHDSTQPSAWPDTAFGCLVEGSDTPLALAMGYKALCDCLGIPCYVVTGGLKDREGDYAWNIISVNGSWYHVDMSRFYYQPAKAFLLSDGDIWGEYEWDRGRYPACVGPLGPEYLFGSPGKQPVRPADTPAPGESPAVSPSPSISPAPSQSPTPSESPVLSPSPVPDEKPAPSLSPAPSESPMVSWSPAPSISPDPSESPMVSWSPAPSISPDPSESPIVSWSPAPSLSPAPGESPSPGVPPAEKPVE